MAWMKPQLWDHILYIDHIVYILNIHIYVYTSMENIMKYRHLCFLLKKCLFWMRKQKIYIFRVYFQIVKFLTTAIYSFQIYMCYFPAGRSVW